MPFIRYIYGPDIAQFGDGPVLVEPVQVRELVAQRRAVEAVPAELEALPKADLAGLAERVGADVKARDSKGHFVKAIAEATEQ